MATETTMIEKATNQVIGMATTANDYALKTTEKAFDMAFSLTGKSIDLSAKVIKKGLEIHASQQDMAFSMLGSVKKKLFKN